MGIFAQPAAFPCRQSIHNFKGCIMLPLATVSCLFKFSCQGNHSTCVQVEPKYTPICVQWTWQGTTTWKQNWEEVKHSYTDSRLSTSAVQSMLKHHYTKIWTVFLSHVASNFHFKFSKHIGTPPSTSVWTLPFALLHLCHLSVVS